LGNLFTDGLAWYVREKFEDIDFVFLNGGYVDNTIAAGQITVGSLLAITEPDNREDTIVILTLKGRDLKALNPGPEEKSLFLFDAAADVIHPGRGGYFSEGTQAFGMVSKEVKYTISYPILDMSLPNRSLDTHELIEPYCHGVIKEGTLKIYNRNTNAWEDVADDRNYRIATASHLALGLDGYLVFPHKAFDSKDTGIPVWQWVAESIYDQGSVTPYFNGSVSIEGGVPLGGIEPQPPYR
jgi:2',3'-cyclic-nucleotide 2'-phosphodiesterase (5'-nucleotidase family)